MARRWGRKYALWALAGFTVLTLLMGLATYPVSLSAEPKRAQSIEPVDEDVEGYALGVTTTQALTESMPANPWNPAFIEAQTSRLKPNIPPGQPGTGPAGGNAPESEPPVMTMQTYTREVTSADDFYTLTVNGTLDPSNSFVRIENVGSTAVVNPKIVVNGKDWSTLASILAQIITPDMTSEDKARAIWEFARTERYHWWTPTQQTSEDTDPVKLFDAYGYGFCTDVALAMGALLEASGIPSRFWNIGEPGQHDVSEAWYDGAWHMLEADRDGLYLMPDNHTIAGVEDLIQDPDLVARAGQAHSDLVPLYAQTPPDAYRPAESLYEVGHEISMTLRPQEALLLAWQQDGLFHNDTGWDEPLPPEYANGQIVSPLDLTNSQYRQWIVQESNTRSQTDDAQSPALSPKTTATAADLVYRVDSPYPIVGITLTADMVRSDPDDVLDVYVNRYPDTIDLLGPDIANNHYQLSGIYVSGTNIASYMDDAAWPPLHAAVGMQPAYLIYHVQPRSVHRTPVQIGGRFYRYSAADGVSMSISFDAVNWQAVWKGTDLGYFDHMEDVSTRVGSNAFYVRYELNALSLQSPYGGWTAGLEEIALHGVLPPDDQLAWSAQQNGLLGNTSANINLTPLIAGNDASAAYHYWVHFRMQSGVSPFSVGLNGFTLTTAIQLAPRSLPALVLGDNQVQYSSDSNGPVNLQVTQQWVESDGWHLPLPPAAPNYPANGAIISLTQPTTFSWQPATNPDGDDLYQYHVEICDRPDCPWPLSSIFDTDMVYYDRVLQQWILNYNASWLMPFWDWFNPGQTYYWRVKAEDTRGLWSEYSPVWSFKVAEVPLAGLGMLTAGTLTVNVPATFTATVSAGSHITYTWNFGDGSVGAGNVVTHTYTVAGNRLASLKAVNPVSSLSVSTPITVQNPLPVVTRLNTFALNQVNSTVIMDVEGESFLPGSKLYFNGQQHAMSLVNPNHIQAALLPSELLPNEPIAVTVFNPPPGGGMSAPYIYSAGHLLWLPFVARTGTLP